MQRVQAIRRANHRKENGDPILCFANAAKWRQWMASHHDRSRGVWLRIAKNGSSLASVSVSEALDVALCYGWITGQAKGESERTWLARFLPRSPGSLWSKINRQRAEALLRSGKMKPPGLRAIECAQKNGRWGAAYDSPKTATVPPDLGRALAANPRANDFLKSLDSANRYAILFRIQTVKKPETRARKIHEFVAMLEAGKTFHPRRRAARRNR